MPGGLLLDFVIITILAVAMAAGVTRGGLREVLSLTGWLLAGIVAISHFDTITLYFNGLSDEPLLRGWAAALFILVVTAVTLTLVDTLLQRVMHYLKADHRDPLLGLVMGTLRGVLLIGVAVILAQRTALPERQVWAESQFIGYTEAMASGVRAHLPSPVAEWIVLRKDREVNRRVILPKDNRGHYIGQGYINGMPVSLLVDTGATVAMVPAHLANGLSLMPGTAFTAKTVTGEVTALSTVIDTLKIGPVILYDVDASLVPTPHDTVLLGMSVLNRLSFQQMPDGLLLEQNRPSLAEITN